MRSVTWVVVLNVVGWAGWLALHRAELRWMGEALLSPGARLQAALVLGFLGLSLRGDGLRVGLRRLTGWPVLAPWPALLLALDLAARPGTLLAPLSVTRAMWTLLGLYGLLGLYLEPARWRSLRPLAVLGAVLLPVQPYLDVYLGFPLRRVAAEAAALALGAAGVLHVQVGTVLQVEGTTAWVASPCAGVQGLWSGAVCLLIATWLEGKQLGWKWAAAATLTAAVWVVCNVLRVVVLVVCALVLELPVLGQVLHTPLGLLGFVGSAAVGWASLRVVPDSGARSGASLGWVAVAAAVVLGGLLASRALPEAGPLPVVAAPAGWSSLPLTELERQFAEAQGGVVVKAALPEPLAGAVAIVTSRAWSAQHLPSHCLRSSGFELLDEQPATLGGGPVQRALTERDGRRGVAVWWFRSAVLRTEDHMVRVWSGVWEQQPWVMVSMWLPEQPDEAELDQRVRALDAHVLAALQAG